MKSSVLIIIAILFSYLFHVGLTFVKEIADNKYITASFGIIVNGIYIYFIINNTIGENTIRSFILLFSALFMGMSMLLHSSYIKLLKNYVIAYGLISIASFVLPIFF